MAASSVLRIAFVGGGNMARSLIGALLRDGAPRDSIRVGEPFDATRQALAADFGIHAESSGAAAVTEADVVVLAIKPQLMAEVCADLAPVLIARRPLIVSIAAGITLQQIDGWLGGGYPVVRSMPNTPALIGAGASGLIANAAVTANQRSQAAAILGAAGRTAWIDDEAQMDVVTALSGSGPAYFFLLIEALEDAATARGLPRDTARRLAIQTCLGAALMADASEESPAQLRQRVTSPGGTTQAALDAFAAGDFRSLVDAAVAAAATRGAELSAELG